MSLELVVDTDANHVVGAWVDFGGWPGSTLIGGRLLLVVAVDGDEVAGIEADLLTH